MLEIQINNKLLQAVGSVKLSRYMKDNPSTINFKFRKEDLKEVDLGDVITLKYKDVNAFKGYIFKINETEDDLIEINALDQLRYLKNQHTMTIKNKTATNLIKELASEFGLEVGELDDTKVDIAKQQIIVENKSLFEIIYDALDDTMLENNKNGRIIDYVLYDDFGKLTLKNQKDIKSDLVFDNSNISQFNNNYSIDSETFNKIFIYYKDETTHTMDKFIVQDGSTISKWGVLQKTFGVEKITKAQADEYGQKLLKYYNLPKWEFSITTLATDINVRGGTNVIINLELNDKVINKNLVVNSVDHIFENDEYTMKMSLIGVDKYGAS